VRFSHKISLLIDWDSTSIALPGELMSYSMNQHRQTADADNLLLSFMVTGQVHPLLVCGSADKTLHFHLFLQGIDLVNDLLGIKIVHHGPE
jgi:hypothetical protein